MAQKTITTLLLHLHGFVVVIIPSYEGGDVIGSTVVPMHVEEEDPGESDFLVQCSK
jgi:hypothetical protein